MLGFQRNARTNGNRTEIRSQWYHDICRGTLYKFFAESNTVLRYERARNNTLNDTFHILRYYLTLTAAKGFSVSFTKFCSIRKKHSVTLWYLAPPNWVPTSEFRINVFIISKCLYIHFRKKLIKWTEIYLIQEILKILKLSIFDIYSW